MAKPWPEGNQPGRDSSRLVRTETGDDASSGDLGQIQAIYRCWLYDEGKVVLDDDGQVIRRGFAAETAEMVINRQQGAIARPVLVKMRLRHFSEGVAIGSKAFLELVFQARRDAFPARRVDGARKIQGVRWGGLMAMRDLRG